MGESSSKENLLLPQGKILNPADHDSGPMPIPAGSSELPAQGPIMIEIPADMQTLRKLDKDLALNWRIHTRELFERAFLLDYQVVDLIHQRGKKPCSFYLLEKGKDED
jgi:predicted GNAT superfamily acetyltransferase